MLRLQAGMIGDGGLPLRRSSARDGILQKTIRFPAVFGGIEIRKSGRMVCAPEPEKAQHFHEIGRAHV